MKNYQKATNLLKISDEVQEALYSAKPIVALESTVISHGLPYPDNIATACKIESAVRESGSIPATIGIEQGRFIIGMTHEDIDRFASTPNIRKVSSRDIPVILANGGMGATTVASTLVAADLANISFFASAGIGGVHRGAESSMDISADLIQFTRSKVAVVCAGAKSILDLGLTMEFLETYCVPIVAYASDDFPAFYSISSGIRSPHRIDSPEIIARTIVKHWEMGNSSSILITSPIKQEAAIDSNEIDCIIKDAIISAENNGVRGPAITPYLMRAVGKATQGRSINANISVLISTAKLAGELAKAYSIYSQI